MRINNWLRRRVAVESAARRCDGELQLGNCRNVTDMFLIEAQWISKLRRFAMTVADIASAVIESASFILRPANY